MLELMARGGMRVGEVLNLTPVDIQERTLAIQNPKSGRTGETIYVPRKLLVRLSDYVKAHKTGLNDQIFPISYVAAWSMVKRLEIWLISNCAHMISDDMLRRMLRDPALQLKLSVKSFCGMQICPRHRDTLAKLMILEL